MTDAISRTTENEYDNERKDVTPAHEEKAAALEEKQFSAKKTESVEEKEPVTRVADVPGHQEIEVAHVVEKEKGELVEVADQLLNESEPIQEELDVMAGYDTGKEGDAVVSNSKTTIPLSDENYYSTQADWQYMSVSQYKKFLECEAAALAKLKGEWVPSTDPKALLVGNYVHSYFESKEVHETFKAENKSHLFSSRKPYGLLKDFQIAHK